MASFNYMNNTAPFWDFVAGLEQQGNGYSGQARPNRNNEHERAEDHEFPRPPPSNPQSWSPLNGLGALPFRAPSGGFVLTPEHYRPSLYDHFSGHHDERTGRDDKPKDRAESDNDMKDDNQDKDGDKEKDNDKDNGEGPSGSGSDTECGRRCGRHGRCGGRRGRHGFGGRGGFGHHHGGPGHHGPRGHGPPHERHGCGPRGHRGPPPPGGPGGRHPWGYNNPFGGFNPWTSSNGSMPFDPRTMFESWFNAFTDQHPSNNRNAPNTDRDTQDFTPEADIFDTPTSYIIHVSLPGAKKEDVGVNWDAEKSELSIAGVIYRPGDEEMLKTLAMDERKVGPFERKIRLGSRANPAHVDAEGITAKLEDGVLRVVVGKEEEGFVEVRKVDVE